MPGRTLLHTEYFFPLVRCWEANKFSERFSNIVHPQSWPGWREKGQRWGRLDLTAHKELVKQFAERKRAAKVEEDEEEGGGVGGVSEFSWDQQQRRREGAAGKWPGLNKCRCQHVFLTSWFQNREISVNSLGVKNMAAIFLGTLCLLANRWLSESYWLSTWASCGFSLPPFLFIFLNKTSALSFEPLILLCSFWLWQNKTTEKQNGVRYYQNEQRSPVFGVELKFVFTSCSSSRDFHTVLHPQEEKKKPTVVVVKHFILTPTRLIGGNVRVMPGQVWCCCWRCFLEPSGEAQCPTMLPAAATSCEQKLLVWGEFLFGLRSEVGSYFFEEAPFWRSADQKKGEEDSGLL